MDLEKAKELLAKEGWGLIPPQNYLIDLEPTFIKLWDQVSTFTMISAERGYALYQSLHYCHQNGRKGDFVECGVWKGGASMLAAMTLMELGEELPHLWLYDTFEGMTEPDEKDIIAVSGEAVSNRNPKGWWAISLDEVKDNLFSTGYPKDKLHFIKGDVAETLDLKNGPQSISVLRLDTDWYQSTKKEMEVLFPRLIHQGVLLLDDYGHFKGARQAVDEYFSNQGILPLLQRVDYTGRLWVKQDLS